MGPAGYVVGGTPAIGMPLASTGLPCALTKPPLPSGVPVPKPSPPLLVSTAAFAVAGPVTGASRAATPEPVVAAAVVAVGLAPNNPPTVAEKFVNKLLRPAPPPAPPPSSPPNSPPIVPSAESMAGNPVLRVLNPGWKVDPGSCGIPSLARMNGSVGSAPPSALSCSGPSPA